jgi:hypothetical protein
MEMEHRGHLRRGEHGRPTTIDMDFPLPFLVSSSLVARIAAGSAVR